MERQPLFPPFSSTKGLVRVNTLPAKTGTLSLFTVESLPAEDRAWLQQQEDEIRRLCRRTLSDHIEIGKRLVDVQTKLRGQRGDKAGRCNFNHWIANRLPEMSRPTVYRLMDVAKKFGEYALSHGETHLLEAGAMYVLAQDSVSPKARLNAIAWVEQGQKVTIKDARQIIAAARQIPDLPMTGGGPLQEGDKIKSVKGYEERMKLVREAETKSAPPSIEPDNRSARAWRSLEELVRAATLVNISTVDDTEDSEPLFSIRAHFKDDGPLPLLPSGQQCLKPIIRERSCVRADLVDAVEVMLGADREERKWCGKCAVRFLRAAIEDAVLARSGPEEPDEKDLFSEVVDAAEPAEATAESPEELKTRDLVKQLRDRCFAEGIDHAAVEQQAFYPISWFVNHANKKRGKASECKKCSRDRVKISKKRSERLRNQPLAEAA